MNRLILNFLILIFSCICFATTPEAESSNFLPPEPSRWEIGLGFNLGFASSRGLVIGLNPSLQYFVLDSLSVGGFIHYYREDDFSFISAGPSATFFIYRDGPLSVVLNQRVRFREYIEPDNLNAAKSVSLTTLAADWKLTGGLSNSGASLRLGVAYRASLDDKSLVHDGKEKTEWVIPSFGLAFYL